ncbi:hypothetical protein JYK18_42775 [Amycolatopsis sp. 195334CR]|nr:hypothetical protein [Amycolatopsis sp. 195334CR]
MSSAITSRVCAAQTMLPMSLRPPAPPAAVSLLARARRALTEASRETEPAERFMAAYLAAHKSAAAVVAARGRPHRGRARPASVWVLLEAAVPELKEWALFFAANSAVQASLLSGTSRRPSAETANELFEQSAQFHELARQAVHGSS